jgi:hypothetical protein
LITDSNCTNDARLTSDEDVIADDGSAGSRSCTDGTPAMDRAVGSDFGFSVNSYRTAVTDDHAGADVSIRMKINEGYN